MELSENVYHNVPSYRVPVIHHSPLPEQKRTYTGLLIGIIIFLLLVNTGLIGIILYLVSNYSSSQPSQLINGYSIGNGVIAQSQQAAVTEAGLAQTRSNPEYESAYSDAVRQATDLKRTSDLTALATTMNIYTMEYDGQLPEGFPDTPRCIGTDPSCYDLYKWIVPTYLDKPYIDAAGGTTGNSGYLIGKSDNGRTTFIVQAKGFSGEMIEVRK